MPAPSTIPDLLDRLRKSGLVPLDRLDGFLAGLHASGHDPATPAELLDRLVESAMITRFHADRLAAGKYKGFQLGSYLILDQLGAGGMGQVYLAEHSAMRRLVALKVFPPYSAEDVVARERFLREARAAATLDHPNIVRVFDLCQEGKILYLVMEFVEGISLQSLVAKFGPLDISAACHYGRQVAFGLHHAYELGFVHRDIKPANLLLDRAGVVKILDLGLVRSEADADIALTKQLDNQTILGTADYLAPEQAVDSSNVDIRADLYALGATLYFLLAGRPLFPEGRTAQKLVWQQIKEPVQITRLRPQVPAALGEVIHTLLQKRPEDRYQTPAEAFDALGPWTQDDIPPPDESLLPAIPQRAAVARAASQVTGSRAAGSTSQILALAMKGSGSMTRSATHRQVPGGGSGGGGSSSEGTGRHILAPEKRQPADPGSETEATALEETRHTPKPMRRPTRPDPQPGRKAFPWKWIALIAGPILIVLILIALLR